MIAAVLAECERDSDTVLDRADSDAIKQRLRENTNSAVEAGVFGVPTFRAKTATARL